MLFHDGRHRRSGCLRDSVALPNWFVTRTFGVGTVVPAGRANGKHARCARGLVTLNDCTPPPAVWMIFKTGLQCSARPGLMIGKKPLGLNWFISLPFPAAGGWNLPTAL